MINDVQLPKLYAPVKLRFWSLRMDVGESLGIVEVDRQVVRKCRRVLYPREDIGWKWQIIIKHEDDLWYYEEDNVCLNEFPMEVDIL